MTEPLAELLRGPAMKPSSVGSLAVWHAGLVVEGSAEQAPKAGRAAKELSCPHDGHLEAPGPAGKAGPATKPSPTGFFAVAPPGPAVELSAGHATKCLTGTPALGTFEPLLTQALAPRNCELVWQATKALAGLATKPSPTGFLAEAAPGPAVEQATELSSRPATKPSPTDPLAVAAPGLAVEGPECNSWRRRGRRVRSGRRKLRGTYGKSARCRRLALA